MNLPELQWQEQNQTHRGLWQSERGGKPPVRIVLGDDQMPADLAYKLACEGVGILWRGDYHNARQTLQALGRRLDKARQKKRTKSGAPTTPATQFHQHRQAQAQRANVLSKVLVQIEPGCRIALRRAPDVQPVLSASWPDSPDGLPWVTPLRELQGLIGAYEWSKKGVEIAALGEPPNNRIFPDYGVYSPVRGEYLELVAQAPLPQVDGPLTAFDIGTGTGVLAALLIRRGLGKVVASDNSKRALACAQRNLSQLGCAEQVQLLDVDLFPEGQADLVVCNPPWLPAKASTPIEQAVYDPDSRMLKGFLSGLKAHLKPQGEGWLVLSDLAEHLELRSREQLLGWIEQGGLQVVGQLHATPRHPKAVDPTDPLHSARRQEKTTLWRLGHA